MLIAGDIGGTKTDLAIYSPESGPHAPYAQIEVQVTIVLNAMRQRVEGSKVRRLAKHWLLEVDFQNELKLAF